MRIKTLALAAITAWMLSAIAMAQGTVGTVYQGQFLPSSGGSLQTTAGGVLSTAGATWNPLRFEASQSVTLKTADGATSTAVFAWSGWTSQGVFTPFTPSGGFVNTANQALMGNYLYFKQVPQTSARSFEFSGLPAGTYDLYAYTQGDSGGNNRQLGMSVGTTTKIATVGVATTSTFVADRNYLLFSGITVGSDGKIAGKVWNGSSSNGEANWNGFQLKATSIATVKTTPSITTAPTATAITYGQTLASSTLSGGAASVPGTFAFTTPGTAPQVGTAAQGVTFTPSDAASYNTVSLTVNVTVGKATPSVTTAPAATGITYGQTLAASTLSGGASSTPGTYAFTTPSTMPSSGTSAQPVTFTPSDTARYNTVLLSANVTVAKATPTITTSPTASPITSAQALASSTLSGGVASVPGTFAFTVPAATPSVGTSAQSVTFTPTDTANYNAVALTVSVTASAPLVFQGQFLPGSGGASQTSAGGVLSTAGATWNAVRFGATGSVALATATGQSSAATFSWSGWDVGTWSALGGFAGTASEALMRNYVWVTVGQASAKSFEFSGLWAGTYNLYVYTQGDSVANNRQLGVSIGATTKIATAAVASSSTFVADRNYLLFSGITVGADGKIAGKFWNASSAVGEANWNGFQLQAASAPPPKATPTISTAPTAASITYGQTLASSTLSGGAASVPGTFAFTTPSTAPQTGTGSQAVTFTPTDSVGYNTVSLTVDVTVGKATPAVTSAPAASSLTYGQSLAVSTLSGGLSSVPGSYAFTTPSTIPPAGTTSQPVRFTPTDSANYNTVLLSANVAVAKATPSITTQPTATAITYGQPAGSSTLSGGVASVPGTFAFLVPSSVFNVGAWTLSAMFTPTDTANYNQASLVVLLTVNKASPSIGTAPTASSITYGQPLASSTLSGGVASVPGTFAFEVPGTVLQAGTPSVAVRFTPTDAGNYSTVSFTVNVTVNKATPSVTSAPAASSITYGQTLASSTLSGGVASVAGSYAFTTPATIPPAGTSAQAVRFTPTDSANYNTVLLSANVTVAKATPSITTAPTATPITFGQSLASSTLSGGVASVPGTFAFASAATTPQVGTASQSVTFTPADTASYNSVSLTVSVSVGKATPSITAVPVAASISFGQTVASATLSGGAASVAGAFAYTVPSTAPDVGTADQGVTFTPADTTRYTPVSMVVSVTVAKATPTIATAPAATPLTFGQTLASSTLSGGVATVLSKGIAGSFAFTTPDTQPLAGTAGQGVTFTPTDTARYNAVSLTVNVTVAKAVPVITTPPPPASIMIGQMLGNASLDGGVASVPGTFAFNAPATQPPMGTASHSVTFQPTDAANYASVPLTVSVTVVKAKPTISTAPQASPINFGLSLASSALSGGLASAQLGSGVTTVAGSFAFAAPSTRPPVGSNPQEVLFSPTDTTRYDPVSLWVNVPVDWAARRASTAALPPQAMAYQGFLTDGAGTPLGSDEPAMVNIVFRIFDAATGGNAVWAERQALAVDRGYFVAQLGEGKPLDGVVNAPGGLASAFTGAGAAERYVGITVLGQGAGGTDAEILPRTRLTAAPYAYLAAAAASLAKSGTSAGIDFSGSSVTVPGTLAAPVVNVASMTVGNLTVSNTLSFSGMAGGFVSSTDVAMRVIAGKHQYTNNAFVAEPSPGYSVSRITHGKFKITFDTPFKSPPQVVATPLWNGAGMSPGLPMTWCHVEQSTDATTACKEVTINQARHSFGQYTLLPKVGNPYTHPNYANTGGTGFPPVLYPTYANVQSVWAFADYMTFWDGDFSFLVIGN